MVSDQKIFIEIWGSYLEREGYVRKGNVYYHCLPDVQLIKLIRMDILGAGFYRIIGRVACYADEIDMDVFKHSTTYDMESFIYCLKRQRPGGMIIVRTVEQQLKEYQEEFDRYVMPMMKDINNVQDCYRFNKYVMNVITGRPFWGGDDLLFESFQCGLYDETLQHAQNNYKDQRQRYQSAKYYHNRDGSISKEQLLREEKELEKCDEWLSDLRAGAYNRLTEELQKRIAISQKNCSKFFARRM